ncbi:5-(carboxyamino)imidazole ribonucleotide mutase [Thermoplasma sp.]|uniref:5-(carboxyamino)imidazole ribonucleotide mutase n=1 Tax=Thermoplasma sp. TaxID=1973142 RepID=UPI0012795BAC|nr:5-(carboxyamino)imidazole ribonucleotide mutase [Thermoplasma sp.]KAA8922760.1 MAG: 5-(carboxyamino)imidazole ribonucleotide mutase [Thermoplasma sp.]
MPKVAVIMGSSSDYETMKPAVDFLRSMNIDVILRIVSAHRTPEYMLQFASSAKDQGIEVIIAGAGGAAHLPGMVASMTTLPVIGVPVPSRNLNGLDSLLSIVQMPSGIPVATVAIGNSKNAAILACRILSIKYPAIGDAIRRYMDDERNRVMNEKLE